MRRRVHGSCARRWSIGPSDADGRPSPAGSRGANLTIPDSLGLAGYRLTVQALPLSTNGPFLGLAELSNGVEMRLGF
jgi:hypothetical protein